MNNTEIDDLIAANQFHPNVEWRRVPGKGRGVFARQFLPKGSVIEWAPISRVPARDFTHADHRESQALRYTMTWSTEVSREKALCWGFLTLYNHSSTPNVEMNDGPIPDSGAAIALRDIQAGEELCFDYGYTWFDVK